MQPHELVHVVCAAQSACQGLTGPAAAEALQAALRRTLRRKEGSLQTTLGLRESLLHHTAPASLSLVRLLRMEGCAL